MSIVVAIFVVFLIGVGLGFQTDTVRRLWKQKRQKNKEDRDDTQNEG